MTCTDTVPPSTTCDYAADCPKFNVDTKDFATEFINELTASIGTGNTAQYSVVDFATRAFIRKPDPLGPALLDPTTATTEVNGLKYTGGWTNTEQAIAKCTETLKTSTADVKYIALITDGAPTTKGEFATGRGSGCNANGGPVGSPCRDAAVVAANDAENDFGISIATVLVSTVSATGDFLEDLASSPDLYFPALSFGNLQELVMDIVKTIDPCEK